jgi:hypothetical protein
VSKVSTNRGLRLIKRLCGCSALDPQEGRANAAAAEAQRQAGLQKESERLEKARLNRELETLNATDPSAQAAGTSTEAAETTAALKAKLAALQAQVNDAYDMSILLILH